MVQAVRWRMLLAFLCGILLRGGRGALHVYNHEGFYTKGDAITFQGGREGLYPTRRIIGSNEPLPYGIRNGYSYINFEHLLFTRTNHSALTDDDSTERSLEILVFELQERERIGYPVAPGVLRLCCDENLVAAGVCLTPGRLIIQGGYNSVAEGGEKAEGSKGGRRRSMRSRSHVSMDTPWVSLVKFDPKEMEAVPPLSTWSPQRKGMYYLWFVSCDANRIEDLEVTGYTEWKNPHGYLPGMMASYLPFYMLLSMLNIVLAFWWFKQALEYWRDLTIMQILISVILSLTMVEIGLWYVDFHEFNRHGLRPYSTTVWATLVGCSRKTSTRVLILLVSMGYGVLRPTLGGLSPRILVLAVAYGFSSLALDLVTSVGAITDLTPATRLILVLPVALLDTLFLVWMFSAVSRVIGHLQLRRRTAKLHLYRNFALGLAAYAASSIGFGVYELYSRFSDPDNEHWETDWLVTGYWHFIALAALCGSCFLWAPSKMAALYAYSSVEERDEETITSEEEGEGEGEVLLRDQLNSSSGNVNVNRGQTLQARGAGAPSTSSPSAPNAAPPSSTLSPSRLVSPPKPQVERTSSWLQYGARLLMGNRASSSATCTLID